MRCLAIFCRVVDNYGDAGVCWRLARQLATEHAARVTLWIDLPQALAALAPAAAACTPADGAGAGVTVRRWDDAADVGADEQVVIAAFGCELPAPVRRRLAQPGAPLWVNLEYLSAEDWVADCHGLPSTKPDDGAVEHFFYPGFTADTGGLLRERGLLAARDAFLAGETAKRWLARRHLAADPDEQIASLFCYPDAPVSRWLGLLADGPRPWRVLVPAGVAEAGIADFLGAPLAVGAPVRRGRLSLQRFALLTQDDYDRLLWCCDLNFVRGEDSWVRAHWAGRPFVWQPYPQDPATRSAKLDAFLTRFEHGAGSIDAAAAMMRAWCCGDPPLSRAWRAFEAALPELPGAFRRWSAHLAAQDDLGTRLLGFCRERL